MTNARAIVQTGVRTLDSREFQVPRIDEDEAILEVEGCGLCGTDWALYEGELDPEYPFIPGHEPIGRIDEIGAAAERNWGLTEGDRVAIGSSVHCGRCDRCLEGNTHICKDKFYYGVSGIETVGELRGGFAEYMRLHPNTSLFKLPEHLSTNEAVLFNPLGNSIGWVDRAGVRLGDNVLIFGPGQRGLGCVIACNEMGADEIIVTGLERDAAKLELAEDLGATHTITVNNEDTVDSVRAIVGEDGIDCAIDTTPNAFEPITNAIELVRQGGTVALTGHKDMQAMSIVPDKLIRNEIELQGLIVEGPWADEQAIRIIASGKYPIEKIHSHTFDLDQAQTALETLGGERDVNPSHITIVP